MGTAHNFGLPAGITLWQAATVIGVAGLVTLLLRVGGVLAANALRTNPLVTRAGLVLPVGVLTILATQQALSFPRPVIACVALLITAVVQWRWRSLMASLVVGTALYMGGINILPELGWL